MLTYQLIGIINIAFRVLVYLIIARCILSFVRHDPYQPIIRFIYDITEPVMKPFRRIIPSAGGGGFFTLYCRIGCRNGSSLSNTTINDNLKKGLILT